MKKENRKTKYFLYARKSTEDEDRQATSISDQIREMKRLADIRGIEIVDIFEESMSAKNIGRPVFGEMMRRIEKGEARGIICWKADRLARNMVDGGNIINMLQNGVISHIQCIDSEYRPEDNVIVLSVAFSSSTQYSKDLSVNVERGMKAKAERGWLPTKAPLGYKNVRPSRSCGEARIEKDESFNLVRILFDSVLSDKASLESLLKKSVEIGLRTKRGKELSRSSVHQVLKNPFYYGKYEWPKNSGNWYTGNHKPMISVEEYLRVQEIITRPIKADCFKKQQFRYRGVLKCETCGGSITASRVVKNQKNGNRHEYVYYHCCKKIDKNCMEKSKPLKEERLEDQIYELLDKIDIPKNMSDWAMNEVKKSCNDKNKIKENIIEVNKNNLLKEERKIDNYIDMRANGEISKEQFAKKRKEAEKNKDYYLSLINKEKKDKNSFDNKLNETFSIVTNVKKRFDENKENDRKKILLRLGSNLSIQDRKLLISLDFRLKPFEKYAKGAKEEFTRFKPAEISLGKRKTTSCEVALPIVWT